MMKTRMIATAIGLGALCLSAQAQLSTRVAPSTKVPGITSASSQGGSFQMGADNCAGAHTPAGTGPVAGVVYDLCTGTTGTTGQTQPSCFFFGTSGITNDVWFDWTATSTGTAIFSTCGCTTDTKIAIWAGSPGACPGGSNLACNDDACGLQSTVSWSATSGSTYTIQLGTFPGAACGACTFSISASGPLPCGQKDDGSTENALGLTNGGELAWMTVLTTGPGTCLETWDSVEAAYGTLMFPGSITNGAAAEIVVYHDADTDSNPSTGLTVAAKVSTVVMNGDTDILNKYQLPSCINKATTGDAWLLASAIHVPGEFPCPMDQTPPTHTAGVWIVGATPTLDTTNLNDPSYIIPPTPMTATGFAANVLLRAGFTGPCGGGPGTGLCFGDGSAAPCGCANNSLPGTGGCRNSVSGTSGALLTGSGNAGTPNSLVLSASNVRTQPGLMFSGVNTIGGGVGQTFGDGIRCCGGGVVRIQLINPPVGPEPVTVSTTVTITQQPAGTKRCYQYWYRDPGGPCGSNFNFTNAYTVTWGP